jgi:uncharacterized protein (DUF1499 family)
MHRNSFHYTIPLLRHTISGTNIMTNQEDYMEYDIASKISHCRYHLYADDVQLYLSGDIDSISDCISRMNLHSEKKVIGTIISIK